MIKEEEKSRKIKSFDEHIFQTAIKELNKEIFIYREMLTKIKEVEEEANSVEELENIFDARSGFKNTFLSFTAYLMENEYKDIKRLEESCTNINPDDLTADFQLKKNKINEIRDSHIIYFTDEELQARKTLEKLMETFNELPPNYRYLIGYNRQYELAYTNQGEYKVPKEKEQIISNK